MRMSAFFSPPFQWTAREDRVAVAWGWPEYRVEVYRGQELVRSVRRAGEPAPVDRAAIRAEHPIDVFDARGTYLGTLPPETPYPAAFLPGGRVVAVEDNELEIPTVVVYRVDREEGPAATS